MAEARLTQTGDLLGTPSKISPERAAGEWESVAKAAGVYAGDAVLHYLLTARSPSRARRCWWSSTPSARRRSRNGYSRLRSHRHSSRCERPNPSVTRRPTWDTSTIAWPKTSSSATSAPPRGASRPDRKRSRPRNSIDCRWSSGSPCCLSRSCVGGTAPRLPGSSLCSLASPRSSSCPRRRMSGCVVNWRRWRLSACPTV